jgi:hypothetical protein
MPRLFRLHRITAAILVSCSVAPSPLQAATDGTLGSNSTGTFFANLTVLPPAASSVQVLGLEDIVLNTTTASDAVQYVGGTTSACLNMTNPGNILVTIAQIDAPTATGTFTLSDGQGHEAALDFTVSSALGTSYSSASGVWETPADSSANCSPADVYAGHSISATVEVQPGTASVGALSGQFSLTIAPKS